MTRGIRTRINTGIDIDNPYSGMQTAIFEMLDDAGRLCQWTSEDGLVECAEALVSGQK